MMAPATTMAALLLAMAATASAAPLNNDFCGTPRLASYSRSQQQAEREAQQARALNPQAEAAALYAYAELKYYVRDHAGAQPLADQALALWSAEAASAGLAADLRQRARKLYSLDNCAMAAPLLRLALAMSERMDGAAGEQTIGVLADLVTLDIRQRNKAGVAANAARLAEAWGRGGEPADAVSAPVYHALFGMYYDRQQYAVAEPLAQRALRNAEQAYGKDDARVAPRLDDLASLQYALMRTGEGQATMARATQIRARPLPPPSEYSHQKDVEEQMRKLFRRGEVDAASGLGERELAAMERALAEDQRALDAPGAAADAGAAARSRDQLERHGNFAAGLQVRLAELHHHRHRYAQAEPLYLQALARYATLGGAETLAASARSDLALLYRQSGDYQRALPLQLQAFDFMLPVYGAEHPDVIASAAELALIYTAQGRVYDAAMVASKVPAIQARTGP